MTKRCQSLAIREKTSQGRSTAGPSAPKQKVWLVWGTQRRPLCVEREGLVRRVVQVRSRSQSQSDYQPLLTKRETTWRWTLKRWFVASSEALWPISCFMLWALFKKDIGTSLTVWKSFCTRGVSKLLQWREKSKSKNCRRLDYSELDLKFQFITSSRLTFCLKIIFNLPKKGCKNSTKNYCLPFTHICLLTFCSMCFIVFSFSLIWIIWKLHISWPFIPKYIIIVPLSTSVNLTL